MYIYKKIKLLIVSNLFLFYFFGYHFLYKIGIKIKVIKVANNNPKIIVYAIGAHIADAVIKGITPKIVVIVVKIIGLILA